MFCSAAAIIAAAVADPLVEGLSNAGAFGHGSFTDHSTADVAPTLSAGSLCAALFVAWIVYLALSQGTKPAQRLRLSDAALTPATQARLFPAIFAGQIGVLFAMESLEQLVVDGRELGGTVWLGGPILASLALHALVGIAVVAVLSQLLRWLAESVAEAITFFRRLVLPWAALTPKAPIPVFLEAPRRFDEPALARLQVRGPPHRRS
jgi:hypothetical protein